MAFGKLPNVTGWQPIRLRSGQALCSRVLAIADRKSRIENQRCQGGGIGRRARLRIWCRKACRFESCLWQNLQSLGRGRKVYPQISQIKFWLLPLIFVPKNLRNLWIKFLCEICGQTDSGTICCPRETLLAVRRNRSRRNALLRGAAAIRR